MTQLFFPTLPPEILAVMNQRLGEVRWTGTQSEAVKELLFLSRQHIFAPEGDSLVTSAVASGNFRSFQATARFLNSRLPMPPWEDCLADVVLGVMGYGNFALQVGLESYSNALRIWGTVIINDATTPVSRWRVPQYPWPVFSIGLENGKTLWLTNFTQKPPLNEAGMLQYITWLRTECEPSKEGNPAFIWVPQVKIDLHTELSLLKGFRGVVSDGRTVGVAAAHCISQFNLRPGPNTWQNQVTGDFDGVGSSFLCWVEGPNKLALPLMVGKIDNDDALVR